MASSSDLRAKEHSHHAANAVLGIKGAQGGEAHAMHEKNDLAHGQHLGAADSDHETMKCAAFQWATQ